MDMTVTAQQVKELREMTGVGMMDCKKALAETNGDMEAAIDWLRTRGLAKAAKKAGRVAAEGLVGVSIEGTRGAIVEVNSETDFVARNEQFQSIVGNIAKLSHDADGDVGKLSEMPYPGTGRSASAELTDAIAKIGENMNLRRSAVIEVSDGVIGNYVHNAVKPGMGKLGVIVGLESKGDKAVLAALGKQLAGKLDGVECVANLLELVGSQGEALGGFGHGVHLGAVGRPVGAGRSITHDAGTCKREPARVGFGPRQTAADAEDHGGAETRLAPPQRHH